MNGTTEKLSLRGEQIKLPISTQQELGRCASCPRMAMGCPGKQEAAAPCPPEAKVIEKKELSAALMDDSIGSISADGGGGFYALPNMAAKFQTAIVPVPVLKQKPVKEQPVLKTVERRAAPRALTRKNPERASQTGRQSVLSALGELAALLISGGSIAPAKK